MLFHSFILCVAYILKMNNSSLNNLISKVGRKFLAPSLSDGAVRAEKERFPAKKWNARQPGN